MSIEQKKSCDENGKIKTYDAPFTTPNFLYKQQRKKNELFEFRKKTSGSSESVFSCCRRVFRTRSSVPVGDELLNHPQIQFDFIFYISKS